MTARLNSNQARDIAYYLHPYTNLSVHEKEGPLIITRGEGIYVYDDAGKRYIEGLGGLWCASLGFSEERLIEAAVAQMRKLPFYHTFGHKTSEVGIELAERLINMAPVPMSKVFFTNSGSEANDTAVKLIWYYHNAIGKPAKKKIIARLRGYHGVTVAAASLTGLPNNHRDFDLPIAGILHTECPHHYRFGRPGESEEAFATRLAEALEALILKEGPDTVAAFFAEPVMGAGGVIVPPRTYFEKIQKVLRKYDVLFVADEVICGFGRTGNMFATTTYGLQPDMISIAKQLSAAYLPIAGLMVNEKIYKALVSESEKVGVFAHGFTYGGHPVPAAVALETLKIYEERRILDHVRRVAPRFQARLAALGEHPLVGEARGVGLIGGLELVKDKETRQAFQPADGVGVYAAKLAQAHGVITRGMGDTLGFCPPLIISEREIDALFDAVAEALDEAHAGLRERQLVAA
ncbi:MAG: aspartate aminotransferase family protein [Alphaproteobacteria bacterium]